nr:hypothetical protein HK105_006693 [Polyrhizophydium stewartii]
MPHIQTEKCIKVIEGHSGEVSAIRMGSNNSIWTGSLDATLRKWSLGDELFSPMDLAFSEAETREGALADSRRDVVAAAAKDLHEIVSGAAGRPISAPVMTEEEERELAELMGEL